jgi:hypothetical protein
MKNAMTPTMTALPEAPADQVEVLGVLYLPALARLRRTTAAMNPKKTAKSRALKDTF